MVPLGLGVFISAWFLIGDWYKIRKARKTASVRVIQISENVKHSPV
jgi:hypothetical protein